MDITGSLAATSIGMSSAKTLSAINVSVLGKALDTVEEQGQAITEMMQVSAPRTNRLDVYA